MNWLLNHWYRFCFARRDKNSLENVAKFGMNPTCGIIVNSSRGVIFASKGEDFAEAAQNEASKIQIEMEVLLKAKNII